jgi:hypothetical protein
MVEAADPSDNTGKPDPALACTAAEFVEAMRRMKRWTGWGYRQLEKRAAAAGQTLPRSTITAALTRDTLPREDMIVAFAHACGCDEEEAARWVDARRRIAAGSVPDAPDVDAPTPISARRATRVTAVRLPSFIRRARWPVRVAIVLAMIALAVPVILGAHHLRSNNPGAPGPGAPAQAAPPEQSRSQPSAPLATSSPSSPPATASTPTTTAKPSGATPGGSLAPTGTVSPPPTVPDSSPPVSPPTALPRCTDLTYRHVGSQRIQLPSYGSSLDCVLSYGAQGEGVAALQTALIYCNNSGHVTGTKSYDENTAAAIAWIQAATGIDPADAIYGPQTRKTLNWVYHDGTTGTCATYDAA